MEPSKMIELQSQMKQNNAELLDFVKDLENWESDVKKKEESLKVIPTEHPPDLPPVRGSFIKKRKKKKEKPTDKEANDKPKKIAGFDFRAWDKYDVDAELQRMEIEKSDESEYETDEEAEEQRKILLANNLKDMGNQKFKEGKYEEAIDCYTRGIGIDGSNAVLVANRAMALLKQEKYAAAELDCSLAISLDPTYVKAWLRRANARLKLKKSKEAMDDYQHVLKLEPSNKQAKCEIERLQKLLMPKKEEINTESGIVKPVYKPASKRSKKPLRRIKIEEIGVVQPRNEKTAKVIEGQSSVTKRITSEQNEMFEHFTKPTVKTQEASPVSQSETNPQLCEQRINKNDLSVLNEGVEPRLKVEDHPTAAPSVPVVPTSSYQFQVDWKTLKAHPHVFYDYFKRIEPKEYCKLFGQALELGMFLDIMKILQDYYMPCGADIYPVLYHFTDIKRFLMTVMFMSSTEKTVLQKLFEYMRASGKYTPAEVDRLAQKYTL